MNNQLQCNIKEPHSHLVHGQTFECEKGLQEIGGHYYTVSGKDFCCINTLQVKNIEE